MPLLSPGIELLEQNKTATASPTALGSAATVGKFRWGPAMEVLSVSSESDLLSRMGEPDRRTQPSWYSAQRVLTQSNDLKLVRVVDEDTALNASPAVGMLEVTITAAGTGYVVGDSVQVLDDQSSPVNGATGTVDQVDTNGEILSISVSRGDIDENTDTSGYSIDITSSGGTGATGTVALVSTSSLLVKNSDDIIAGALEASSLNDLHTKLKIPAIFAKYPGDYGNNITVDLISYEDWVSDTEQTLTVYPAESSTSTVDFADILVTGPEKAGQYGAIVYVDGVPQGNGFVFSLNEGDRDSFGSSIFLDNLVAFEKTQDIIGTASYGWDSNRTGRYELSGGFDEAVPSGSWILGWDLLNDPTIVDFQYACAGGAANESVTDSSVIQKHIISVMELRRDARARLSPPRDLVVGVGQNTAIDNVIEWFKGVDSAGDPVSDNLNSPSTYVSLEDNFKYQYDKFNDQYFWMGLSADATAADLFNAREFFPWMSAAGSERAQIRDVVKLAYQPANRGQRDRLYKTSINPITSEPGGGVYINGDKTLTTESTAFNRINVRDLFNLLKRSIRPLARTKLFQINNEFNRSLFREQASSFMSEVQGLGGVIRFQVICDETNNPASVVDTNRFVGTIRVVPPRSINFITLNFGAYGSDVNFDELG